MISGPSAERSDPPSWEHAMNKCERSDPPYGEHAMNKCERSGLTPTIWGACDELV